MWLLTQSIIGLFFPLLKQFVLVLGDSHLRGFVDGYASMPDIEQVCFGVASFPGIKAKELAVETDALILPPFLDPQVLYNCFV